LLVWSWNHFHNNVFFYLRIWKMISDVCLFFFLDFLLYVFFLLIMLSIRNLTFRSLRYICFILKLKYWPILSFLFAFFFYSRFLLVVVVVVVGDTKQMFIILYLFCLIDYRITNIAFLFFHLMMRVHIFQSQIQLIQILLYFLLAEFSQKSNDKQREMRKRIRKRRV
jgi:hypothetical protein